LILTPKALVFQPLAQSNDGIIATLPILDFHTGAVRKAVVAGAVVGDTVAHRLNQNWSTTITQCSSASLFHCFIDSKDVVSIDSDSVNAVSDSSTGNSVATVLF
jgi:hypothetical protein